MKIKYAPSKPTQKNAAIRGSSNSNGGGSIMDRLGGAPVYVYKILYLLFHYKITY
jgi:hypothetical protein